jgi:hypothetical protein
MLCSPRRPPPALQVTFFAAILFWNSKREAAGRADILFCLKPKPNTDCLHRGDYNPDRKGVLDSFFADKLPPLLLHPIGKAVVLIAFVALAGSSIYSTLKVCLYRATASSRWHSAACSGHFSL